MKKYETFNLRFDYEFGADQFRGATLDEVKAHLVEQIEHMKTRKDISEENRQYWLEKFAKPIFVHRIVVEDVVEE